MLVILFQAIYSRLPPPFFERADQRLYIYSCARVTARARSLQLDRNKARARARKKPNILGLGCSLTMAAETEQFTTVIMVLPADDLVDYFSLENKPSFSYLCTVSDRYSFGIGIGRYIGLADMGKAYRLSVSGDKIVYIGSLPIKYKIG